MNTKMKMASTIFSSMIVMGYSAPGYSLNFGKFSQLVEGGVRSTGKMAEDIVHKTGDGLDNMARQTDKVGKKIEKETRHLREEARYLLDGGETRRREKRAEAKKREELAEQRRAMLESQHKEKVRLLKSRKSLLVTMMSDFDHLKASSSKVGEVLNTLKEFSSHELATRTEAAEISQIKGLLTNQAETHSHALALIQHLVFTMSGNKPVADPKNDVKMGLGKVIERDKKHVDDLQPSVTVARGAVERLQAIAKADHIELNHLIENVIAKSSTQTIEMLLNKLSQTKDKQSEIAEFIQTRGDYYQKEHKSVETQLKTLGA